MDSAEFGQTNRMLFLLHSLQAEGRGNGKLPKKFCFAVDISSTTVGRAEQCCAFASFYKHFRFVPLIHMLRTQYLVLIIPS
jgi:hypothetical protein